MKDPSPFITKLTGIRGARASIILALVFNGSPLSRQGLTLATDYTDKPLRRALDFLQAADIIAFDEINQTYWLTAAAVEQIGIYDVRGYAGRKRTAALAVSGAAEQHLVALDETETPSVGGNFPPPVETADGHDDAVDVPAEGESPARGGNFPPGSERSFAEAEAETPSRDGKSPAGGGNFPPDEHEQDSGTEGESPVGDGKSPAGGGNFPPDNEMMSAEAGTQSPSEGGKSPARDGESPAGDGNFPPLDGLSAPSRARARVITTTTTRSSDQGEVVVVASPQAPQARASPPAGEQADEPGANGQPAAPGAPDEPPSRSVSNRAPSGLTEAERQDWQTISYWLKRGGVGIWSQKYQELMDKGLDPDAVRAHVLEREAAIKAGNGAKFTSGLLIMKLLSGDPPPLMRCEDCLQVPGKLGMCACELAALVKR